MYEYAVKEITKVIDGDTVDVVIDLGFDLSKKERVRLAGIDTPESRTRDAEEKVFGLEAKAYLKTRLENCEKLIVKTEKDGKYFSAIKSICPVDFYSIKDGDKEKCNASKKYPNKCQNIVGVNITTIKKYSKKCRPSF